MNEKAIRFLNKKGLKATDILYFKREGRKTVLSLTNGAQLQTYIPVKYLLSAMPKGAFLNITKGLVISAWQVKSINGNVYTLSNGQQFTGRVRGGGEHRANRKRLEEHVMPEARLSAQTIYERFAVMDASPLAFCVIELVYNTAGHSVDFVFRYCNRALADLEGYPLEELLDHSYYDVYQDPDLKWLDAMTDVIQNGTLRVVDDINAITGKPVSAICTRVMEGFCICILVEGKLIKDLQSINFTT